MQPKPIKFPESNVELQAPAGVENCEPLNVFTNGQVCLSCWKVPFLSRLKFIFTGKIWLGVCGHTQPPVYILVNENPFVKAHEVDGDNQKDK